MIRNDILIGAGIGGWIGSVASVFLTRSIVATDTFTSILLKGGWIVLVITFAIFIILKFLKVI